MAYHVTIDPVVEDGTPVEAIAEAMVRLGPATILVDLAGPMGRVLLASLQARGLPATALEKRPRPTLPEVQHIEHLSKAAKDMQETIDQQRLELRLLREYKHDVQILIARLE